MALAHEQLRTRELEKQSSSCEAQLEELRTVPPLPWSPPFAWTLLTNLGRA